MEIVAEVSGVLRKVIVVPGQQVTAGEVVAVLESMKMELPVPAPTAGVVVEVRVVEGDHVNEADVLAVIT